jgi:hypothetical protein
VPNVVGVLAFIPIYLRGVMRVPINRLLRPRLACENVNVTLSDLSKSVFDYFVRAHKIQGSDFLVSKSSV